MTGVLTCALPISESPPATPAPPARPSMQKNLNGQLLGFQSGNKVLSREIEDQLAVEAMQEKVEENKCGEKEGNTLFEVLKQYLSSNTTKIKKELKSLEINNELLYKILSVYLNTSNENEKTQFQEDMKQIKLTQSKKCISIRFNEISNAIHKYRHIIKTEVIKVLLARKIIPVIKHQITKTADNPKEFPEALKHYEEAKDAGIEKVNTIETQLINICRNTKNRNIGKLCIEHNFDVELNDTKSEKQKVTRAIRAGYGSVSLNNSRQQQGRPPSRPVSSKSSSKRSVVNLKQKQQLEAQVERLRGFSEEQNIKKKYVLSRGPNTDSFLRAHRAVSSHPDYNVNVKSNHTSVTYAPKEGRPGEPFTVQLTNKPGPVSYAVLFGDPMYYRKVRAASKNPKKTKIYESIFQKVFKNRGATLNNNQIANNLSVLSSTELKELEEYMNSVSMEGSNHGNGNSKSTVSTNTNTSSKASTVRSVATSIRSIPDHIRKGIAIR